jgi:hypothetical protein
MDILAHALWAGIGCALARHRVDMARRTAVAVVTLAVLPDVVHMLPVAAWTLLGDGAWTTPWHYAHALPGHEPALPASVALWSHHLHCAGHSAIVASLVTAAAWLAMRTVWLPLVGWWSHIAIDVFTHSLDYYPAPVLYPLTMRGFDGLAWNRPWFQVANYAALALAGIWVTRRRRQPSS